MDRTEREFVRGLFGIILKENPLDDCLNVYFLLSGRQEFHNNLNSQYHKSSFVAVSHLNFEDVKVLEVELRLLNVRLLFAQLNLDIFEDGLECKTLHQRNFA